MLINKKTSRVRLNEAPLKFPPKGGYSGMNFIISPLSGFGPPNWKGGKPLGGVQNIKIDRYIC
jgi:hypothetical protein